MVYFIETEVGTMSRYVYSMSDVAPFTTFRPE